MCGEKCYLYFVGNFMCLSVVKNCENMLGFDKVTAYYKTVPFYSGHGVVCLCG